MNFRKFLFIFSTMMMTFLFTIGSYLLCYMVQHKSYAENADNNLAPSPIIQFNKVQNKAVNILLLGGDEVANNSDTMMVVNFNPYTTQINILSIPRDTKVRIKGNDSKINAAYPLGGPLLAVATVQKTLGIHIDYYVFIDVSLFREIITLLGGVDYYVPVDMNYDDPTQKLHIHLKQGYQHLNGAQAEQYMRFRQGNKGNVNKYYDGSDLKRIDAQQNFIREVIKQKANIFYVSKIDDILNVISKRVKTNLTTTEVLKMITNIDNLDTNKINMFKLPGNAKYESGISYYICDNEEAHPMVQKYFSESSTGSSK